MVGTPQLGRWWPVGVLHFFWRFFWFPPYYVAVPFDAARKGAIAVTRYRARYDGGYQIDFHLKFPPSDGAARARVQRLAGFMPSGGGPASRSPCGCV
jgi:hypothetical protein